MTSGHYTREEGSCEPLVAGEGHRHHSTKQHLRLQDFPCKARAAQNEMHGRVRLFQCLILAFLHSSLVICFCSSTLRVSFCLGPPTDASMATDATLLEVKASICSFNEPIQVLTFMSED